MRIPVHIEDKNGITFTVHVKQGTTLFSALREQTDILFHGNCGAKGICNACKVYDVPGDVWLRACKTQVEKEMWIRLQEAVSLRGEGNEALRDYEGDVGVAVDLGTTGVSMAWVSLADGTQLHTLHFDNPQIAYGADVISRLAFDCEPDNRGVLHDKIWNRLHLELEHAKYPVSKLAVSGNTTMLHILCGYPTTGLLAHPFTPHSLAPLHMTMEGRTVLACPGLSAFVGADVVSGACALELGKKDTYELLIDLGTNGELLLLNKDHGYAGSTACGPAFDGYLTEKGYGTDMLSAIYLLLERRIIDGSGKLTDRYFDSGYTFPNGYTVHQEDIRNVQKAKGAVYAGISTLLHAAGVSADEIDVYVSGNFGFHLNPEAAYGLKLFPAFDKTRVQIAGNTSLAGAKLLLTKETDMLQHARLVLDKTETVSFAQSEAFGKLYMDSLSF